MREDVLAKITQSIATQDALLADISLGSQKVMKRPTLGAMQQKNFIQPPSMMGGRQPMPNPPAAGMPPASATPPPPPPAGGMPPAGSGAPPQGFDSSGFSAPASRPVTAPYKSAEAQSMLARIRPEDKNTIQATRGMANRGIHRKAMAAEQKAQDAEDLRMYQAKKKGAEMFYEHFRNSGLNHQQAQDRAEQYMSDPKIGAELTKSILASEEAQRVEAVEADILSDVEKARVSGYMQSGMPYETAVEYAKNEDMSLPDGVKLWQENQEREDLKASEAYRIRKQAAHSSFEVDAVLRQLNKTLEFSEDFGATGILGAVLKKLPQTSAYALDSSVDVQKAKLAFDELLNMRRQSETGGALGNVSNREIELLYSAFTNLDTGMGKGDFQRNLADVMQRFERVKFFIANEEKFSSMNMTADEMNSLANRAVSMSVAKTMDTPPEAIMDLYADPASREEFEKTFGWQPIQLELDEGHRKKYGD